MKSPFPGMDPYLEACWGDVHVSLVIYARNQLQRQLPGNMRARVEEQVTDPETLRSIHIVETGTGHRLVTAIEFLSPTNKENAHARRAYRKKQQEFRKAGVSLVEVDLLRSGEYVLAAPPRSIPAEFEDPYRVCISRGWWQGRAEFYHLPLRSRLPAIRIPLREADRDVVLDLQPLIDAAYADGGYDDIDYSVEPEPPLAPDDAQWADELLRQQGKR
jgi:Protein of unknown function (DUF4058)